MSRVAAQDTLLAAKDAEIADLKRKVEDLTQMVLMLKERARPELGQFRQATVE